MNEFYDICEKLYNSNIICSLTPISWGNGKKEFVCCTYYYPKDIDFTNLLNNLRKGISKNDNIIYIINIFIITMVNMENKLILVEEMSNYKIYVHSWNVTYFFNTINDCLYGYDQEKYKGNYVKVFPYVIFKSMFWSDIVSLFKIHNYNISGGSISKRHMLSTVETNLAYFLMYLNILSFPEVYKSYKNSDDILGKKRYDKELYKFLKGKLGTDSLYYKDINPLILTYYIEYSKYNLNLNINKWEIRLNELKLILLKKIELKKIMENNLNFLLQDRDIIANTLGLNEENKDKVLKNRNKQGDTLYKEYLQNKLINVSLLENNDIYSMWNKLRLDIRKTKRDIYNNIDECKEIEIEINDLDRKLLSGKYGLKELSDYNINENSGTDKYNFVYSYDINEPGLSKIVYMKVEDDSNNKNNNISNNNINENINDIIEKDKENVNNNKLIIIDKKK